MTHATLAEQLQEKLGADWLGAHGEGDDTLFWVSPGAVRDALVLLKKKGCNMLVDLTAVDRSRLPDPAPRFEVTWRLMALDLETGLPKARLALKTRVAEGEAVPTAKDLWPIADWLEREVWDMFGVPIAGRPGIKRLQLYEEFVGHPLRKDYPIAKRQPLIGPPSGEPRDNPSFNAQYPTATAD